MALPVSFWRYYVPNEKGEGWAICVLGTDGFFATVSDYGNYAYCWTATGEKDFRRFFIDLNWDYVARKLAHGHGHRLLTVYDGEETLVNVKKHIIERRREGQFNRNEARTEWELLEENDELSCPEWFAVWYTQTKIADPHEYQAFRMDGQLEGWAKRVLPRLQAMIRSELEREQSLASSQASQ